MLNVDSADAISPNPSPVPCGSEVANCQMRCGWDLFLFVLLCYVLIDVSAISYSGRLENPNQQSYFPLWELP